MSKRRRQPASASARCWGWLLPLLAWPAPAGAHDFTFTETLIVIKHDGTFVVDMTCDLDELLLGLPPGQESAAVAAQVRALPPDELEAAIERLAEFFRRRVRVIFDGTPAELSISFPEHGTPLAENAALPTVLGTTARLSGRVPPGARVLVFRASAAFPPVALTIFKHDHERSRREILGKGVESAEYLLGEPPAERRVAAVAWPFLLLGFEHILPEGVDHILFVLGLYLLSPRLRPLLWQVTAFTVAHTATLALSMYGIVSLPARVVEPLIALSIVYVAVENLVTQELKWWRPMVVFGFGLLHGLGFAGVLTELAPPRSEFATALLSFNVGVELGQLAVIGLALLLTGWWRGRDWYRGRIAKPASLAIAAVALFWTMERMIS
ncbi:MAG: HupE/UreJ family protein [Phycisphaerae bacterium]|nr:HupE/UreJ family protein [Phycisphaerae bacterium]